MDPQQQFCLKWNSYTSNLAHTFSSYFKSESLADVTLFCGGTIFKAHKLILAACSKHFADLFQSAPVYGNCCVILEATSAENMSALLEFMYKGEVHVSQESLNSFLKAAECLQVKGLSTEHGRLAAAPSSSSSSSQSTASSVVAAAMAAAVAASTHDGNMPLDATPPPPTTTTGGGGGGRGGNNGGGRGGARNGSTNSMNSGNGGQVQQNECDSLMHPNSSSFHPYISPIYRPNSYDPLRKKHLKSPFTTSDAIERGSVLRDGSKSGSSVADNSSPGGRNAFHRPGSSASSTGPVDNEYMQVDGSSPNQSSPTSGSINVSQSNEKNRNGRLGNNGGDDNDDDEGSSKGAEDLRVKSEPNYSPLGGSNTQPPTPTTPGSPFVSGGNKGNGGSSVSNAIDAVVNPSLEASLAGNLANIATADMLNIWTASKLASKGGSVNTADGKKLKCPFCERLYGYETNLRAHIRQRHQGIRVHCPYCTRTFTRNNTVRRHIAREHKHEQFSVNNKFETPSIPIQNQLQNHSQ